MAKQYSAPVDQKIDANKNYTATIETSEGTITADLYPKIAPQTVNAFVFLARDGFYEGVIFHRIIPGFMIQGGDPLGTGTGGPGFSIKGEVKRLHGDEGALAMANSGSPDTAGSQFYVTVAPYEYGDQTRGYTVFGKVVSGMDVVKAISKVKTSAGDRPVTPVVIKKLTIERVK